MGARMSSRASMNLIMRAFLGGDWGVSSSATDIGSALKWHILITGGLISP